MAEWEQPGYSDITVARVLDDDLDVVFANGDHARVPLSSLEFGMRTNVPSTIIDDGLAIRLGEGADAIEISWVRLRSVLDPAYAQHLAELDTEESRRLGRRLRALREDRGLSLDRLAKKVGMSVGHLSNVERGDYPISLTKLRTLLRAMDARLADIARPKALDVSVNTLIRRAVQAGVPQDLAAALTAAIPRSFVPAFLADTFAWAKEALLSGVPETSPLSGAVQFKVPNGQQPTESPLVHLGFSVARLARTAFAVPPYRPIPANPSIIRQEAVDAHGQITLPSLLDWTWRRGIPVLPMSGSGAFAAAVLEVDHAPTIIIKESRRLAVIWLFDLAHELGHLALGHVHHGLIDVNLFAEPSISDRDEQAANDFALELLLPSYKALLDDIRADARGDGVRFKFAVERVATRARVTPGVLGMAAAFALPEIGRPQDRWGSATNLAKAHGFGREQSLDAAQARATVDRLSQFDAALIRTVVLGETS